MLNFTPDPWDGPDANDRHDQDQTHPRWHGPPRKESEDARLGREQPLCVRQITWSNLERDSLLASRPHHLPPQIKHTHLSPPRRHAVLIEKGGKVGVDEVEADVAEVHDGVDSGEDEGDGPACLVE